MSQLQQQEEQDRWARDLLTDTLGIGWYQSDPQARKVADAAALRFAQLVRDNDGLLALIFRIRAAAAMPNGKTMEPWLDDHIREMRDVLFQIREDMRRTSGGITTDTLGRLQAVIVAAGGGQ